MELEDALTMFRKGTEGIKEWNEYCRGWYPLMPDFDGADLSGLDLPKIDFHNLYLGRVNLSDTNLRGADLSWASLPNANLTRTDLSRTYLIGTELSNAILQGACLSGAIFSRGEDGDRSNSANFENATLTGATMPQQISLINFFASHGLESANFGDESVLDDYIFEAFAYLHEDESLKSDDRLGESVRRACRQLKLLRPILTEEATPKIIVTLLQDLNVNLLNYLRAHPDGLFGIRSYVFEQLVAEVLASHGWDVRLTSRTRDGGYDLFAISGCGQEWLIECKRYAQHRKVGIDIVRALYGTRYLLGAGGANLLLATTSSFSTEVQNLKASRYDLELRDFEGILDWLNFYKPHASGKLFIRNKRLIIPE